MAAEPLAGLGEVLFVEGGEKVVLAGKPGVERATDESAAAANCGTVTSTMAAPANSRSAAR